ncbi:hypothetical protein ACHAWF_014710 [Thalassiosira exigua]
MERTIWPALPAATTRRRAPPSPPVGVLKALDDADAEASPAAATTMTTTSTSSPPQLSSLSTPVESDEGDGAFFPSKAPHTPSPRGELGLASGSTPDTAGSTPASSSAASGETTPPCWDGTPSWATPGSSGSSSSSSSSCLARFPLSAGGTPPGRKSPGPALVSRLMSNRLGNGLVTVTDDEVVVTSAAVTSLPELEASSPGSTSSPGSASDGDRGGEGGADGRPPRRLVPPPIGTRPPATLPVSHKMLYQSVSAIASPSNDRGEGYSARLNVGPEREVYFRADSLGIQISRCADGYVRVLSVTPLGTNPDSATDAPRVGDIFKGDVVREVGDVNLRAPIDPSVWKLTVGLIKMAPRPLRFAVAKELKVNVGATSPGASVEKPSQRRGWGAHAFSGAPPQPPREAPYSARHGRDDPLFGPTREVLFHERQLGVKLHRTPEGRVRILSVTPYRSFPGSPASRTGEMRAGDVVLEVGGVWDLREPIDGNSWGVLVKFIKETRRPLCVVVADAEGLRRAEEAGDAEEDLTTSKADPPGHFAGEEEGDDDDEVDKSVEHLESVGLTTEADEPDDANETAEEPSANVCTTGADDDVTNDALEDQSPNIGDEVSDASDAAVALASDVWRDRLSINALQKELAKSSSSG